MMDNTFDSSLSTDKGVMIAALKTAMDFQNCIRQMYIENIHGFSHF